MKISFYCPEVCGNRNALRQRFTVNGSGLNFHWGELF